MISKCALCEYSRPTPEGGWKCMCGSGRCDFRFVYDLKNFLREIGRHG